MEKTALNQTAPAPGVEVFVTIGDQRMTLENLGGKYRLLQEDLTWALDINKKLSAEVDELRHRIKGLEK